VNQWITDRLPTYDNGFLYEGYVWVMCRHFITAEWGVYVKHHYDVLPGEPWAPIEPPELLPEPNEVTP